MQPAAAPTDKHLVQAIDTLLEQTFTTDRPGAAIIVARDGRAVYRKGFGLADLEHAIPIEPGMVFRIASLTKQFTAVAILMLVAQGKLSLTDELGALFPDYPAHGRMITVEQLLAHTSGLTDSFLLPKMIQESYKDISLEECIVLFKDLPLDFPPGTWWKYSNDGYLLLGMIIESISGVSYERFLEEHIFHPLGMHHTFYDRTTQAVPGRVMGYQYAPAGFERADYGSTPWPHAAGGLLSSVDDLLLWDEALYTDRLIDRSLLERAFTPALLSARVSTHYGYGWGIAEYEGHGLLEHEGGSIGFRSFALRIPDWHVFVAVLMNSSLGDASLALLALRMAALTIGKPYQPPMPISLDPERIAALVGVYQFYQQYELTITSEGERLFIWPTGWVREEVYASSPTELFPPRSHTRYRVVCDAAGEVTALEWHDRLGPVRVYRKTAKPLPRKRGSVPVNPALYDSYVGEYRIGPYVIDIFHESGGLSALVTGEAKQILVPESETVFFIEDADISVVFEKDQSGYVGGLVVHRAGQEYFCKKQA